MGRWKNFATFLEQTPSGQLSAAGSSIQIVLGLESFTYQAIGVTGSPAVFGSLSILPLIAPCLVLLYLQRKTVKRLQNLVKRVEIPFLQEEVDSLVAQVDPEVAQKFQGIITKLEDEIYELKDEKRRRENRELPGEPRLIRSGSYKMGIDDGVSDEGPSRDIYVDAFLIDPYPVTNQEFLDFLREPGSEMWLPEQVQGRYGIPYYLVEWQGLSPP